MELPEYVVPDSLLSPQLRPSSRGDHTLRAPRTEIDDLDRESTVTGKRKRRPVSRRVGLPQYAVPQSLLPSQAVHSSHEDLAVQVPVNEIPATISHPESGIPVHSQPDAVCLALDTHYEAQNHSSPPFRTNVEQSEELLHTRAHSGQPLGESPDLLFHTAAKDLGIKYDCFLGDRMALYSKDTSTYPSGMSNESFFPTPAMTDAWGEAGTPDLSWNSATELPPLLDKAMPAVDPDAAVLGSVPERCEFVSDRRVPDTHNTVNAAVPLPRGESQLDASASTEARLSHVLKAVAAAGFDSLDNAVVAYYQKSLKNDEWLRQEQRLNRIRRLPVLLKELHLAAQSWSPWQRRSFQEQIIKSTEDILIAELEDHLTARRPDHHKARDETDIEAELPNTWTLMTSLSTKYNMIASKDCRADVPKLVGKFLIAGTDLRT